MDKTARASSGGFSVLAGAAASALGGIVVNAASAAAGAVAGFVGDSIKAAGGFEANMNQFAAAAGDSMAAAGLSTQEFSDLFLDLGAKLPVSTLEVQEAAIALVKGGIDPAIIAAGGLESSLNFAAAAGMELEAAADLSVKMLGTFTSVTDDAATKTAFMAEAQDLLTKAANASTLDVASLGDAMLAAGGQAKAAGLEYEDFVTTMGLISPAFGSAAEAGTSFKNMLVRLQPSTKPAAEAMAELGLVGTDYIAMAKDLGAVTADFVGSQEDAIAASVAMLQTQTGLTAGTKDFDKAWDELTAGFDTNAFYDAQGNFLGMENAAQRLQDAFSGLSEADRIKNMQLIFGNDAMGAAAALADGGSEAYRAFAEQMMNANGVTAQAAAVNQGFDFAMNNLMGTIEGVQIRIGLALLPTLGQLVTLANTLINAIMGDAAAFAALPGPLQSVITIAQQVGSVIGDIVGALMEAGPMSIEFAESFGLVHQGLTPVIQVIQQAAGLIMSNWQPALAAVAGVITALVAPALAAFVIAVAPVVAAIAGAIAIGMALHTAWTTNFMGIQEITAAAMLAIQMVITQVMTIVSAFWQENGAEIMAFAQTTWSTIQTIIGEVAAIIGVIVMSVFSTIAAFLKDHGSQIQAVLTFAWNSIQNIIQLALNVIQGITTTVLGLLTGNWEQAANGIQQIVAGLGIFIGEQFQNILQLIEGLVPGFLAAAQDIGSKIVDGLINGIKGGIGSVISAAQDMAQKAIDAAMDAIKPGSPSRVFTALGLTIPAGLAQGISLGAPQVGAAAGAMAGGAVGATQQHIRSSSRVVNFTSNNYRTTNNASSDRTIAAALAGV